MKIEDGGYVPQREGRGRGESLFWMAGKCRADGGVGGEGENSGPTIKKKQMVQSNPDPC